MGRGAYWRGLHNLPRKKGKLCRLPHNIVLKFHVKHRQKRKIKKSPLRATCPLACSLHSVSPPVISGACPCAPVTTGCVCNRLATGPSVSKDITVWSQRRFASLSKIFDKKIERFGWHCDLSNGIYHIRRSHKQLGNFPLPVSRSQSWTPDPILPLRARLERRVSHGKPPVRLQIYSPLDQVARSHPLAWKFNATR